MYIVLSNSNSNYLKKVNEYNINLGKSVLILDNSGKVSKTINNDIDTYISKYDALIHQIGNIRTLNVYVDYKLPKDTVRFYDGLKYTESSITEYTDGQDMVKKMLTMALKPATVETNTENNLEERKKAWIERLKNEN